MNEVERLTQYTKEYQEQLKIERERKKLRPNQNMDLDIGDILPSFDFYCDTCQEDFSSPARKTKNKVDGDIIATIRGVCPYCGDVAIRYATHRDQDPYYQKSPKVRRQRNYYLIEMLQNKEYGFKTYYGDPEREYNEKLIAEEEFIISGELEIGLRGQSLKTQERLNRLYNGY